MKWPTYKHIQTKRFKTNEKKIISDCNTILLVLDEPKIVKGARFELARSTDQQITLVKKDLNLHLKSVTLDQLGQPS